MIEICAVGGFSEVGKNMTAVKVDDDVVILDMGFHIPSIVSFEEEGGHRDNLTSNDLIKIGAIPDDNAIAKWKNNVRAIVLSHCHLDHIGGCPYLAKKYDCDVIGTPYTLEVLKGMLKDERIDLPNYLRSLNAGSTHVINKNLKIEFVGITHSTLQTVLVAIHTKYGVILYTNDFKFDNHPVIGKKPDYEKIKALSKKPVVAIIVDSLYADTDRKTPSEAVARELLKDVMLGTDNKGKAVIVTTFASNIARLKSIVEFGKTLNRKVVFMGRSLAKYNLAAERLNLTKFLDSVHICTYGRQVRQMLKKIERNREKYLIVCTGNQAEPRAILTRMVNGDLDFKFKPEDHVIFSCRTIPVEPNKRNREQMEKKLKNNKVRIFTDIHQSGHCGREDLRDLINYVKPKHILPAHGAQDKQGAMAELAEEMGYKKGKNVHLSHDGLFINIR